MLHLLLEHTLEHSYKFDAMKTFLELNPNIKIFSSCTTFLWQNRDWILNANIRLNVLRLYKRRDKREDSVPLFNLLNELQERGFYKRLFFYYGDFLYDQNGIDQLGSVNGLAKLAISHSDQIKLCALNFRLLRCLCCDGSDQITNLEMNCTSLEQIVFEKAHPDHILMLCGRAAHLEIIVVSHITTTNYADRMSYGTVRGSFDSEDIWF